MAGSPHEPTPRRTVGNNQTDGERATILLAIAGWTFILGTLALAWLGWL